MSDALNLAARASAIDRLTAAEHPLDVLVVGGGVTGAGIAVDAATRGLSTGIVEATDWASGTSSKSSNLIHGGLRYLKLLDFALVREALSERELLLDRVAPHLVKPQRFVFPLRYRWWQRIYVGVGILLYDIMATIRRGKRRLPVHRHLTRRSALSRFPSLSPDALVGAIEYWDATVDDAALVTALVRTAVREGASAASRVAVLGLIRSNGGRVSGVHAFDHLTGQPIDIHARRVITATGAWTDDTEDAFDASDLDVLASKGVHVAIPRDRIDGSVAIIRETASSVLFVIPAGDVWVVGTTDTPWRHDPRHVVANQSDISYLLGQLNAIVNTTITESDVLSVWAGLRPLLQPMSDAVAAPAKVSREHTVVSPFEGLTLIAGGKLTTYRVMARDAVDLAIRDLDERPESITHRVVLVGSDSMAPTADDIHAMFGWNESVVARLLRRYGSRIHEIVGLCNDEPGLAKPLEAAESHLRAEVAHAVLFEGAMDLDDIMERRMRISRRYPRHGLGAAREVASVAGAHLGWSPETTQKNVADYTRRIEAIIAASRAPTDGEAVGILLAEANGRL